MNSPSVKICTVCENIVRKELEVHFCPVCGAELVEAKIKESSTHINEYKTQKGFNKNLTEDSNEGHFNYELDRKKIDSLSWQMNEHQSESKVKKHETDYLRKTVSINRFDGSFVWYSYILVILCNLGAVISLFFIVGGMGSYILYKTNLGPVYWIFSIFSLLMGAIFDFLNENLAINIISRRSDIKVKQKQVQNIKKRFLIYLIVYIMQIISCFLIILFIKLFYDSVLDKTSKIVEIILNLGSFALFFTFLSPSFKIAKVFSNTRDESIYQNLFDSFQFQKFSTKKTSKLIIYCAIFPLLLLFGGIFPIAQTYMFLLDSQGVFLLDTLIYLLITILLIIFLIGFKVFMNVKIVSNIIFYEYDLEKSFQSPLITWISKRDNEDYVMENKRTKKESHISNQKTDPIHTKENVYSGIDERCPHCSASLIGKEQQFCVNCGAQLKI